MSNNSGIVNALAAACLLLLAYSCGQPFYKAYDFTPEKQFTNGIEGAAADKSGAVYAVNFAKEGTIGKVTPDGKSEQFFELPTGSVGNAIRFGKDHEMYVADYKKHIIYRIDMKSKLITEFAKEQAMSQPNDMAISKSGFIYLTDPNWKKNIGRVWKLDKTGRFMLLEPNMGTTNGIEVSADEKHLYVGETNQNKIWQFDLDEFGNTTNKRIFYEYPGIKFEGMRCDERGNLYVACRDRGTVLMLSPKGTLMLEVPLKGKMPTNLTFGGKDHKMLYVTMADRGCFEKIKVIYRGRE